MKVSTALSNEPHVNRAFILNDRLAPRGGTTSPFDENDVEEYRNRLKIFNRNL